MTFDATTTHLNALLRGGGIDGVVSRSAVTRHAAALDAATAASAHRPDLAERNVAVSIDVAQRVIDSLAKLDALLPIAEASTSGGPNWGAILGVIRESREQTKLWVDVMDRVHNAEQVARFQAEVMSAIDEADPVTATRVRASLRRRHALRRAALAG